jgi:hypothetical protein
MLLRLLASFSILTGHPRVLIINELDQSLQVLLGDSICYRSASFYLNGLDAYTRCFRLQGPYLRSEAGNQATLMKQTLST